MRNPNKATTRVSINRPDTYERLPRTCEEIICEQQPVHTFEPKLTTKDQLDYYWFPKPIVGDEEMLSVDAARAMVKKHITHSPCDLVLFDEPIAEGAYGWVFGYQSKRFLKTGSMSDALAGNAPILVNKHTKTLHTLGTAYPLETYIENYIKFGDPHKTAGLRVELVSNGRSVQTIDAIRCIRDHSGIGLAAGKRLVEECLSGGSPTVECLSIADATILTDELTELGYIAKQLGD